MKKRLYSFVGICALVFAVSGAYGQDSSLREQALVAFEESEDVQELLDRAEEDDKIVSGDIDLALLRGSCGVAGCTETYLVTQAVSTEGVNPQTSVVAAVVVSGSIGNSVVQVVSESKLAGLTRSEPRPRRNEDK